MHGIVLGLAEMLLQEIAQIEIIKRVGISFGDYKYMYGDMVGAGNFEK